MTDIHRSDDAYFEIVPATPVVAAKPKPGEIARGAGWRIARQEDGLWLFYLSPSHQGDERAILIRENEADALASGKKTLDDILIARRAD